MLTQHPLSAAFPSMPDTEFKDLCADIEAHGLLNAVVVFEGQVLDGWHRYRACETVGIDAATLEFDGGAADARAFVLSSNLHRRSLTPSQRSAAIVACVSWAPVGRPENPAPGAELGATTENLAKLAGVSKRTVEHAKAAERAGLGEAVRDGKVSAKRAAEVAKLPAKERAAALENPPRESAPHRESAEPDENGDRMADLLADYESASRVIQADDKLAEAMALVREKDRNLGSLNKLYQGKCAELASMTREAKRWKTKFEKLEAATREPGSRG